LPLWQLLPLAVRAEGVPVPGIQIGELLVEQGILTPSQVEEILATQKKTHRPFGDLAERLFGVSPKAIEDAWVEQYVRIAGITDLEQKNFDTECLRLLNRRQAWQFHTLPVHRDGEFLNIATSPEKLVRAVNFAARTFDEPVMLMIAHRKQLQEFLMKHYPVPKHIARYAEAM
jgi:MSHA biogenesis protein MshE